MSQEELDELVAEGAIERVVADPETARTELEQAQLHVESAAQIAERDPVGGVCDRLRRHPQGGLRAHAQPRLSSHER
jgi:hypothetical protein